MNTASLLRECELKNIRLQVVNDQLHYRAPKGSMTDDLKERLKSCKPELIRILSAELSPDYYGRHIQAAIAEFNSYGIRYTDIPQASRRKADKIEKEMTEAANRGDREEFQKALKQWSECFH